MSMRTLLSLLFLISTSLLAAPSVAEAGLSNRASAAKRVAASKGCRRLDVRGCSLHGHQHVISAGIFYFNSRGSCLRRLNGGITQIWRPATTRIEYRMVPGTPRFRTVTRYRTIVRGGVRIRIPYCKTIKIPGITRRIAQRVHVPGAWVLHKPVCSPRYGSRFSFLQSPRS